MKHILILLPALSLAACGGDSEPKSGALPGPTTASYDAPTNYEASASYKRGFTDRFDIPELDYPQDIKDRIRAARLEKFERRMRSAKKRQEIITKLALTAVAVKDPDARQLLKDLKDNPKKIPDAQSMSQLFALAGSQSNRKKLTKAERQKKYGDAVKLSKSQFKRLTVESCRWTEMKRLIGSGHEQMAFIYGVHPTHGYKCEVELTTEKRRGYPRKQNFESVLGAIRRRRMELLWEVQKCRRQAASAAIES